MHVALEGFAPRSGLECRSAGSASERWVLSPQPSQREPVGAGAGRGQIPFSRGATGAVLPAPAPRPLVQLSIVTAATGAAMPLAGIPPDFGSVLPFAVFLFTRNSKIIYVNQKRGKKILSVLRTKRLLLLPEQFQLDRSVR